MGHKRTGIGDKGRGLRAGGNDQVMFGRESSQRVKC